MVSLLLSSCFMVGKVHPLGHTDSVAVFIFPVISVLSLLVIVPALAMASPTALAGKNAGVGGIVPPRPVGAQRTRIAVSTVVPS